MTKPETPEGAQTVRRAIRILKLIAAHPEPGMRLIDIATDTGLQRPTVHRLLKALTAEGMLAQHPGTRRYSLGSAVFDLGLKATHQFNLRDICQPVLARLAEQTGDTTFFFVRSGNDAVCIAREQGTHPIQTPAVPIGARQPLGVNAGGLAFLSVLSEDEVEQILDDVEERLSIYGGLTRRHVFEHWKRSHEAGFALIGNRAVPGVTAIGLAVMSQAGWPIGAITVAAINSRMESERIQKTHLLLREATDEMSRLLRQ